MTFAGKDVIAQAQSGTGKTATFAISILQTIKPDINCPQALVIAPTRELAHQVSSTSFFPKLCEFGCILAHSTLNHIYT